ncbi:MAG: M1 family aminopeptidase [Bacteroidia bacterium]|nr:M1 family aminopeptidase [Bacteroidia bacterium]
MYTIFLFELRYRLKRPATYIYMLLFLGVGLLYGSILAGGLGPEPAGILTGGGKNLGNSPYSLHLILISLAQIGIFAVAAFMGVPVIRDFEYHAHELFFTKPITKLDYLGGRYLGSLLLTVLVLICIPLGLMIAFAMPYAIPEKVGPFSLSHYVVPFVMHVLPFTLFTGSIFFATVSLSRNNLFIYLNAIVVIVLLSVASALTSELDNKTLASLLDPTGSTAFTNTTEYWTVAERNTRTLPATWITVGNQAIWAAVGLGILALVYARFRMAASMESGRASAPKAAKAGAMLRQLGNSVTLQKVELPKVRLRFGMGPYLGILRRIMRQEFRWVISSPIFWAIVGVGILLSVVVLVFGGQLFGTPTLPVTYQVLAQLQGQLQLFILAIIVFYTGEMVWRERGNELHEIYDALPMPTWITLAAKYLAITGVIYLLMAVVMLVGLTTQVVQGFFTFNFPMYFAALFFFWPINLLIFSALAFFVQILSQNKFLGFFLTVLVYLGWTLALGLIGVEDNLASFSGSPGLVYSDMNGYGHYAGPYLIFKLYWGSLAAAMLILGNALWQRGTGDSLRDRLRSLGQRLDRRGQIALGAALAVFLGTGGFIYYNTHILNDFQNSREAQRQQAEQEKAYSRYAALPMPRITDVRIAVDLFPKDRNFDLRGSYRLENKTDSAVREVHLSFLTGVRYRELALSRPAERTLYDTVMGYAILRLAEPMLPGDTAELRFEAEYRTRGFVNSGPNSQIVANGTFLNHYYFPLIGYQRDFELQDTDLRKKYGLPERERFPNIDDTAALRNTLFANDADWIGFEAVVSTEPDQIALAPGYLEREWNENGRRYFHYKMDSKMAKFWNISSARYTVQRDVWKAPDGRDISLEIYHHASHTYNLERMMEGMKRSLEYYTEAFGPYQHRQVRILEFPRYQGFAQSFANTIPFSEAIGFIADVKEGDVDYPLYITAHEVAHQWWAHQVAGGAVQGFQFLSETMSQYAALMVMAHKFGPEEIRKYLKYEMNQYLQGRTGERVEEKPALLSENQLYIHYNKGSVIMYALQDYIGEDSLNAALKRYVAQVRFQEPPYTTTREWRRYVDAVTPDSVKHVLRDWFDEITLYDLKTDSVRVDSAGGAYKVILTYEAKKFRDDGRGEETEVPVEDYVDVGIFAREKTDGEWKPVPLYFRKHKLSSGVNTLEIPVDRKPYEAGIDPYNKLIDRKPDDNTRRF